MAKRKRGIELTKPILHAIGWDAGNRSMQEAGRKVWNKSDGNYILNSPIFRARCVHGVDLRK